MRDDQIIFKSAFDGKEIQIPVTRYFKTDYNFYHGKCWAAWCNNAAVLIHFSRTGRADRAYCYHKVYDKKVLDDGRKYGGIWFMFMNGKMKEYRD